MDTRYVDPSAPGGGHETSGSRRRWPRGIRLAGFLLVTTAGVWALCALSLMIYVQGARAPQQHILRIPAGTSERIAAGENPLDIPVTWSFVAGDTLKLVNDDRVDHLIGSYKAPAHASAEYTTRTQVRVNMFCSLHPSGAIVLNVEERGFNWRMATLPTIVFGPSVGLVLYVVHRVLRQLDTSADTDPDPLARAGRTPTPVP